MAGYFFIWRVVMGYRQKRGDDVSEIRWSRTSSKKKSLIAWAASNNNHKRWSSSPDPSSSLSFPLKIMEAGMGGMRGKSCDDDEEWTWGWMKREIVWSFYERNKKPQERIILASLLWFTSDLESGLVRRMMSWTEWWDEKWWHEKKKRSFISTHRFFCINYPEIFLVNYYSINYYFTLSQTIKSVEGDEE